MKTRENVFKLILFVLALVCYAIAFTACSYESYPSSVYSPTYEHPAYKEWNEARKKQNEALLKYTQSAEFKAKYGGTSAGNNLPGTKANSVIGTTADPYNVIRTPGMGVYPTIGVRIYK